MNKTQYIEDMLKKGHDISSLEAFNAEIDGHSRPITRLSAHIFSIRKKYGDESVTSIWCKAEDGTRYVKYRWTGGR